MTLRWRAGTGWLRDVRYGVGQMRRRPVLSAVVVLSLALGIGANTALFTVVRAVTLRTLRVEDPSRLMVFQYREPAGDWHPALEHRHSGRGSRDSTGKPVSMSISWPSFVYLTGRTTTLSSIAGFVPLGMFDKPTAIVRGEPMFVDGEMVTSAYFPGLGVAPIRGRLLHPDDERPDAPRVGVISERFWDRAWARSPEALGSAVTINGVPVTVVGVAPASFTGLENGRSPDIWVQMGPRPGLTPWGSKPDGSPQQLYAAPDWWWLQVVCRVKDGVTVEQARSELDRLFRESLQAYAANLIPAGAMPTVALSPAADGLNVVGRRFSKPLTVLTYLGAVVLLIACANVATLLLASAASRRREVGIRMALGAPRRRLVRQLLTESAVFAAAGASLGLLFATWGGRTLFALLTRGLDPIPIDISLDRTVLAFTALVSLLTTALFGLAPAFRATRLDIASDLKASAALARGEAGATRLRGGKLVVVAQIALSLPLVVGAGLLLQTLANLAREPLGFDPDQLLVFKIDPSRAGLEGARLLAAYEEIQARLRAIPGVRGATMSRLGLITGWVNNGSITLEDQGPEADRRTRRIHWNHVGDEFFETIGIPLVLGRRLDARDTAGGPRVAVVNETMARLLFPDRHPIGRRFWIGRTRTGPSIEVVGVVRDAKYGSLRDPVPPTFYIPYAQSEKPLAAVAFAIRTASEPSALMSSVRQAVGAVVAGVPIGEVKTQTRQIDDSLGQETMYARLFSFFGAAALLLACIGLYGTMTFALGRRTREIGIRMALGAGRRRVLASALAETLVMTVAGIVVGSVLAWAGARYVRSLLFGVTPLDGPTLAGAGLVLLAVALGAGYLPARRASRLDPLEALRES